MDSNMCICWERATIDNKKTYLEKPDVPEVQKPEIEPEVKSEKAELLNETEVETDLKSRKRHAEDEIKLERYTRT